MCRLFVTGNSRVNTNNSYTPCFYSALQAHGVEIVTGLKYEDKCLVDNASDYDAVHIQWFEYLWKGSNHRRLLSNFRAIASLYKYLNTIHRLGKALVVTMHNIEPHESFNAVDRFCYKLVVKSSDVIVCHSRDAASLVRARYRPSGEVVVMHHGNYEGQYPAPQASSVTKQNLGFDLSKPVVSCIGNIRNYKNLELACDAVSRLGDSVQLLVAGEPFGGTVPESLQAAIQRVPIAKLQPRKLTAQEYSDYISASDLILLPYAKITGSGAMLAAWSLERSVLASDLPFFREMFDVSETGGALFRENDAEHLASMIRQQLSVPAPTRSEGARQASKKFSWESCVTPVVITLNRITALNSGKSILESAG